MSRVIENPFDYAYPDALSMLATTASSLFAGRVAQMYYGSGSPPIENDMLPKAFNMDSKGGRSFTETKTNKKMQYKKRKLATVAVVNRMINGILEKKQKPFSCIAATMTKRVVLSHNVTAQIAQGTADGTRVGDQINLQSLIVNFSLSTNTTAAFYKYRVIVGWSGEEFNTSPTLLTTNLGATDVFIQTPNSLWELGIINTKSFTPVFDKLIEVNSLLASYSDGVTTRMVIPFNQKFSYQAAGSTMGKTKNLYIVLVPAYEAVVAPADSGDCVVEYVMKYTDA